MMYLNLLLLCLYSLSGKSSESVIIKNTSFINNYSNLFEDKNDSSSYSSCYYPTILIHGIASNKNELNELETSLHEQITRDGCERKNIYNLEIGNGKLNSIFMNINLQCEIFYNNIINLELNTSKINLIGISQGGLIARCYVERYSHLLYDVNSLITLGTPHMGIFGESPLLDLFKYLEYWKNPYEYNRYIEVNDFLVYLNNEKPHNLSNIYKNNLNKVNSFVMIWSEIDIVIIPYQSAKFEFYNILLAQHDHKLHIDVLENSTIYTKDLLGFKKMIENYQLYTFQYDCNHDEFKTKKCYNKQFYNHNETLLEKIISFL